MELLNNLCPFFMQYEIHIKETDTRIFNTTQGQTNLERHKYKIISKKIAT